MNWKTWVPLVLAVVLGLVAMKVARDMMARNKSGTAKESGMSVVVVKNDVPAGAQLTAEDLTVTRMSGELNPQVVFSNATDVEGRVAKVELTRGAPVMETLLAPKGTGAGLQALIPEGRRAITVEINEFSGVAGFLTPGCRVDVVATLNGEGEEMVSRIIVQNIVVQAVGARTKADGDPAPVKSVTLIVAPKEAEAIELAAATGRPRLVLRSGTDNDTSLSEGVTVAELRRSFVGRGDPFSLVQTELLKPTQTTPVQQTGTGATTTTPPASQPIAQAQPPTPRWSPPTRRQITIIRAGVESQTSVEDPFAVRGGDGSTIRLPKWMTGAGTDELPAGKQ
jgi:pilus assembly protein CpaB